MGSVTLRPRDDATADGRPNRSYVGPEPRRETSVGGPKLLARLTGRARQSSPWKHRLLILIGLGTFMAWPAGSLMVKSARTLEVSAREQEAQREVEALDRRVAELRTLVAYLSTDAFVEVAARERLGLVRPGDQSVIILPEDDEVAWVPPAPAVRSEVPVVTASGRVDAWFRVFFGTPDEGLLRRHA